jgi:hypothetical protein
MRRCAKLEVELKMQYTPISADSASAWRAGLLLLLQMVEKDIQEAERQVSVALKEIGQ